MPMASLLYKLSYARSLLVTAPLIFLYTAVMGSISVACSILDSRGRVQHACARIWSRMILWTARIRVRVTGLENIKPDVPYVLCVNHQSHMDIPIILATFPFQFRFAAKKQLFRYPFLGWHLGRSGHVPIDRENPHAAVKSIREAAETIQRGTPMVIFPEGGTSLDGSIKPFKRGGFMLATKSKAEVVPVTIRGSRPVLAPKTYHIRGGSVEVTVGNPIASAGLSSAELANRVREEIVAAFNHEKTLDRNSYSLSRKI
ncbi:MAG: 1-acyl-sn-glycerol-3-phosphate acyltransferase [Acidobacteria bacterium]|nr:MAG: 1-acyl-sn-glycerol-3-phosphate acyltransferase [Acidobacteriota bacterium]